MQGGEERLAHQRAGLLFRLETWPERRNLVKFVKREVQSPAPGKG